MLGGTEEHPINNRENEECLYFCFNLIKPCSLIIELQAVAPTNSWTAGHLYVPMERSPAPGCHWVAMSFSTCLPVTLELVPFSQLKNLYSKRTCAPQCS